MTNEQKLEMEKFGITGETKLVFHFEGRKYDRLEDALSYAAKSIANEDRMENDSIK